MMSSGTKEKNIKKNFKMMSSGTKEKKTFGEIIL